MYYFFNCTIKKKSSIIILLKNNFIVIILNIERENTSIPELDPPESAIYTPYNVLLQT